MYPIGHVAFSYLLVRPLARNQPIFAEFAALTAGTLFPAASNVTLTYLDIFGINHFWSHSPLLLIPLGAVGVLSLLARWPYRRTPLFFTLGVVSHLINDILFDFPLIYFSNKVDDIGGPWFYPWRPFLIRYDGPGFEILPWELLLEGAFLLWMVWKWKRWDLAIYGAFVAAVTVAWLVWRQGVI
jgi:hypothetical protein